MFKALENAYEWAPLPLRVGIAALLGFAGFNKIKDPAGTAEMFGGLGFPVPEVTVWVAIAILLLGALFLLLGLWTRVTATVLTVYFIVAVITAYIIPWDASKMMMLLFHLPLLGGTIALMFSGPGKWSLDEKFFWE